MNNLSIVLQRTTKGALVKVDPEGDRSWTAQVKVDDISDVLRVVSAAMRESGWGKWSKVKTV